MLVQSGKSINAEGAEEQRCAEDDEIAELRNCRIEARPRGLAQSRDRCTW